MENCEIYLSELAYCDMCGKKFPFIKLLWMDIDEYGPIYYCLDCYNEDATELFTTDKTIEK